MANYERLSALDESFLAFETPNTYMHVALVTVFEPGEVVTGEGLDIGAVRRYFASRLHLVPRYRQKLRTIPLTGDAVWIDDPQFQIEYHVRHASLPRPGSIKQLQRRCAEILERALDRERPLWESWFIEGLEGGRFAMITKVHHCMVDGVAGVDILAALLGLEPDTAIEEPRGWSPRSAPTDGELLGREMARRVGASGRLLRGLGAAAATPSETGRQLPKRLAAIADLVRAGAATPAETSFNTAVGPHRRVAWTSTSIDDITKVKESLGGTLNDVVLTTASGALQRFLDYRGEPLREPFRIVVPVSVRARDERGQTGNRVSAWMVDAPIAERSAKRRFAKIAGMTRALKEDESALGGQMLTEAAELTTGNILSLGARLLNQTHLFNMIVTNVPGPRTPLFLLDSKMVHAYPHVPLFNDQGLGIALFSYEREIYWGVAADWDLVPDVEHLENFVAEAFAELTEAATAATAAARRPARRGASKQRGGATRERLKAASKR